MQNKKTSLLQPKEVFILLWSHLGSNQGLPDYESGALTS